ncbi:Ldh family oxidoreductase [Sulfitobacter mediterraneus]|jgi:(2R)-3-sulfolactate dehydrogenase (NADP+)|uniref:Ldh family oxidoreductase n=1 Tax=Sulfitobacter mediterraneus TaxID=83219 RepID=UPI001933423B|nr:Ldh family oxidoreductase [Sulfitobacter mediterraneus]MBM1634091.1 Ldh family oxidoreductase [Sulfitobacter mediterraneus]MBM1641394.1 Ldh family oxidoreductase [Sulfitobacter mediterraneus]MBM1645956.1 Ldh family oxidoreductase [Sulfitobacter mediterraneus]MBM1649513.1 Ldh family oxidoreductase [Sulfitobacter mediterraneus]MBM1654024.1 Ldh family oxidoreductase [Sulfitobacter mediterraneus]
MAHISLKTIEETTQAALIAHGADAFPAAEVARAVAKAEAVGNKICGLYYVESYCQQLASGRVKGKVVPVVNARRSAAIHVDAGFGFAQPAFAYGLPVALDAAREAGVATMAVGHAHTCTSLGYFTEQIAHAGLIGIGFTNASPIVAAPGGKTRVIGTNPIAFSVPDGAGGIAMQFDQSTTTVALGKITMAKAAGQKIPEGWAVDADGNPTTDPEAALGGSLVSMGGYKGWGFGLMAEILAAGMTGGILSKDVKPLKAPEGAPHDLGQYYIIIDPSSSPEFGARLEALAAAAATDEGARMPGQNKQQSDPVEVDDAVWAMIEGFAKA